MTLLWTVLPPELVLDGWERSPVYEEVELAGTKVVVERVAPFESRIVRLLSTAPADYLRPELQPGASVTYRPALSRSE